MDKLYIIFTVMLVGNIGLHAMDEQTSSSVDVSTEFSEEERKLAIDIIYERCADSTSNGATAVRLQTSHRNPLDEDPRMPASRILEIMKATDRESAKKNSDDGDWENISDTEDGSDQSGS